VFNFVSNLYDKEYKFRRRDNWKNVNKIKLWK
jgi:hypothetical protein